jgi:hypothetical protein
MTTIWGLSTAAGTDTGPTATDMLAGAAGGAVLALSV